MTQKQIDILRQYPAESHDTPLEYLANTRGCELSRYEYEASPNPLGVPKNARFLLDRLFLSEGEVVVLGAEPYDPRIPAFARLARRHDVILHTSWPYWGTDDVPQPPRFDWQRRRWREFLGRVHAVGVTDAATESVEREGADAATHIPHAVDTTTYAPEAATEKHETALPVVLFVGRLERRKGILDLLQAIEDWEGPAVRFRFVGEGPLAPQVESAARDGPVEYFGYVGEDDTLASLYATADVLALPSFEVDGWEELFGIVIIEAFASGVPVVSTDCIGPASIIEDGETGFVVPQRCAESLRDRLKTIVSDPNVRDRMGKTARTVAEDRYDIKKVAERWRSVIDSFRRQ